MWRCVGLVLTDVSGTLKMEAIRSSETSVNKRPTQRHIPENDILHSHRCESLKSYIFGFTFGGTAFPPHAHFTDHYHHYHHLL
jgi:hypothetical protein